MNDACQLNGGAKPQAQNHHRERLRTQPAAASAEVRPGGAHCGISSVNSSPTKTLNTITGLTNRDRAIRLGGPPAMAPASLGAAAAGLRRRLGKDGDADAAPDGPDGPVEPRELRELEATLTRMGDYTADDFVSQFRMCNSACARKGGANGPSRKSVVWPSGGRLEAVWRA